MAIRGWTGPTRMVDGVGEVAVVRVCRRDDGWNTRWHKDGIFEIETDRTYGGTYAHCGRMFCNLSDGVGNEWSMHPDDITALNALAEAHGGTWHAAPEPDGT